MSPSRCPTPPLPLAGLRLLLPCVRRAPAAHGGCQEACQGAATQRCQRRIAFASSLRESPGCDLRGRVTGRQLTAARLQRRRHVYALCCSDPLLPCLEARPLTRLVSPVTVHQPNFVTDCLLTCCCPTCVIYQNANQARDTGPVIRACSASAAQQLFPAHVHSAAGTTKCPRCGAAGSVETDSPPGPQVGKRACFTEWKLTDLLAPPTPQARAHALQGEAPNCVSVLLLRSSSRFSGTRSHTPLVTGNRGCQERDQGDCRRREGPGQGLKDECAATS